MSLLLQLQYPLFLDKLNSLLALPSSSDHNHNLIVLSSRRRVGLNTTSGKLHAPIAVVRCFHPTNGSSTTSMHRALPIVPLNGEGLLSCWYCLCLCCRRWVGLAIAPFYFWLSLASRSFVHMRFLGCLAVVIPSYTLVTGLVNLITCRRTGSAAPQRQA